MYKFKFKILFFLLIFLHFNGADARIKYNFNDKNIFSKDIEWNIIKTIHFNIYYPVGYKNLALLAAQNAEDSNKYVSNYLDYNLNRVVEFFILPSILYENKLNIDSYIFYNEYSYITPKKLLIYFTGDYKLFSKKLTKKIVYTYYNDIFFNDITGKKLFYINENNVHAWILNGLAEYIANGFNSYDDMIICDLINNDTGKFDINKSYIWNNNINSVIAKSFFFFYEKSFSKYKLIELIKDFRDLNDFEKAIYFNTGREINSVNKSWINFYINRYSNINKTKLVKFENKNGLVLASKLSNDGKKIAYFISENNKVSIYIENLLTNKRIEIYEYNCLDKNIYINNFNNSISWSNNETVLFRGKRNSIIIYNIKKEKIINELTFPFTNIKYPVFSNNGKKIIFVGYKILNNDIYSFSLKNKKLKRLTNDNFNKRFPILSKNNRLLIYSSNINKKNNLYYNKYKIIIHDLKNNSRQLIGNKNCNNIHPKFDEGRENLIFVSDKSGIYNTYIYNIRNKKYKRLSDTGSGLFYPDFVQGKDKYYVIKYNNKNSILQEYSLKSDFPDKTYFQGKDIKISEKKLDQNQLDLSYYSFQFDYLKYQLLLDASNKRDCSPELQVILKDKLSNHKLTGNIQGYIDKDYTHEINYTVEYSYLQFPLNFTIATFREKTPFGYYALLNVSDYFYNCYSKELNFSNIGFYSEFSYPIVKFLNVIFKTTLYHYKKNSDDPFYGENVSEKIISNYLAFHFNNVLYGFNRKFKGTNIKVGANLLKNANKEKYFAYNFDLKVDQYFHIFDYSLFKINMIGGYLKEFDDKDYFNYYLGGDNNFPAYEYGEFSGNRLALIKAEFDLSVIHGINMGFLGNVDLRLAVFGNLGACWNDKFHLMNKEKTEYDDIKMDTGSGLIISSDQKIFFRFDCVWPYFYKRFGEKQYLFNIKIIF